MKLSISTKAFIAIQTLSVLAVLSMGFAAYWSFTRSFVGFLNEQAVIRMTNAIPTLEDAYTQHGSWQFLVGTHVQWFELLSTSLRQHEGEPHTRREPPIADLTGAHMRFTLLDAQHRYINGYPNYKDIATFKPVQANGMVVGWMGMTPFESVTAIGDERFQQDQVRSIWLIVGASLIISSFIAWRIARTLSRPIRQVALATHRLARGEYSTRVGVHSQDEVGQLAQDFNQMAKALENNENMRRHFMADISHELRTPLAVLKGEMEALEDGIRPLTKEAIASLQAEVESLSKLVDDIFALSLSELGAQAYQKRPVQLESVLYGIAATFERRCLVNTLSLTLEIPGEPLWISGDESRLQQLFTNLLENSLRYTDAGGHILIRARRERDGILISCEDSAPGVSEEQLGRLFERFYRVEQSRNRATGGAGLGLAICRGIVEAHGGRIDATSSPLGGLCVTLQFDPLPDLASN